MAKSQMQGIWGFSIAPDPDALHLNIFHSYANSNVLFCRSIIATIVIMSFVNNRVTGLAPYKNIM